MKIREVMTKGAATVKPDANAIHAAKAMLKHDVGALPVCNDDMRLQGMVTDRDIVVRCLAQDKDPARTMIANIMSDAVVCVEPDTDVHDAAEMMSTAKVRRLPVLENGTIVGIVSLGDLAVEDKTERGAGRALGDISEPAQPRNWH